MTLRRPESVLVLIYDQQNRVLVMQRKDDPEFWQSVTGTLETGETPMQTAIREVREETGIDIRIGGYQIRDCQHTSQYEIRPQWRHRYPPDCRYNTEYLFALQVSGKETIKLSEHLCYQWLDRQAATDRVWSQTNKDAIERIIAQGDEEK